MRRRVKVKELSIKPEIHTFDKCEEFITNFKIGKDDLIITSEHTYNSYFKKFNIDANVIFIRKYGSGEPNDEMVEAICSDIKDISYKRVIAIGGGSVLDVSKLFALKTISPVTDLFDHKLEFIKDKELIMIPTTCGTGSEVTNISILELKSRHTKLGLAVDELYADYAVMIPELLEELPFKFFATSSIDALIHAIESSVSPKATSYTEMFSYKAMEMILKGYQEIEKHGPEARIPLLKNFLLASNYAGIAFGNAGCGAVHAMSYPLGANYHVPHGESNYVMFTGVFKKYQALKPNGKIKKLNAFLCEILHCREEDVYVEIEELLNVLIPKKPLCEYCVSEEELRDFTESVMTKQGRLMANNYTELTEETVYRIYRSLY
ncbi:MAG: alcohol dehydrogenase, class [Clostridium sp.]|jgi:4-hydroxybutyrate dehydrogenase|nr:alcohol dehydrogenase, class [Clostridium sp.]